jgi:GNAT superfamily N-acetyltransferase
VSVEIRPVATDAEHEVALALNNEIRPTHAITLDDVRAYVAAVPQQHWLAWDAGTAVGTASAAEQAGRGVPIVRDLVRPDRRREGIGTALYGAVSGWARERGSNEVEAWIDDEEQEGLAFAAGLGFRELSRELKVALDLDGYEPPPVDPPPGIEIVTWAERPDATAGMHEVYVEAEPDIPGYEGDEPLALDDWLTEHMVGPGDRPEWTFVALAGDEVVGYAKFSLTEAQPQTAFHDLTGVKRAWRGRGIAAALKRTQVRWAKDNGYARVVTNNEERNEPIRRLNERMGYRPALGRRLMRGPLARTP